MYLKSIEVQGFKSFANKIVFEFHNGITGIVGPNGSGKSNVADAVRWVLGEQRAKQLRGGNMQDVIFSGTENRKPLSYASVAITLDNSDHALPIEYQEVKVTRKLYRSGESEYLLNGNQCRLKDINELFYDTGIGKEGYSIIGQGQIDKILNGKPEERRELFDEAAGIVKFKRRKNMSVKKLEEEQSNLVRVTDILSELEKQYTPLKRQAEKAREYLKFKEELKRYDINLFLMEHARLKAQIAELEEAIRVATEEFEQVSAEHEQMKLQYEEIEELIEEIDSEIEHAKNQLNETNLLKQQLLNQIELLKEQINSARSNDLIYENRKEAILKEIGDKEAELALLDRKEQEYIEKLSAQEEKKVKLEQELAECDRELRELAAGIEKNQTDRVELVGGRASTQARMQRFDTLKEQIQVRRAELNQRLLSLQSEKTDQSGELAQMEKELKEISDLISLGMHDKKAKEEQVSSTQQEIARLNEKLRETQIEYHRQASRLESLTNLTERYEGFGNSIKKVMECRERISGIHGVVADIIKVKPEYEIAIETALGGSIQNIVTDSEETARELIDYLKKNKFGRATFLPLTAMKNSRAEVQKDVLAEKGVIGTADKLVATDDIYRQLIVQLLGKTVVCDNIDTAIRLSRKYRQSLRIVTPDGELMNPGGSMSGGAFKNSSNLLARRRELENLEKQTKELAQREKDLQNEIRDKKQMRQQMYLEIEELQKEIQEELVRQNTAKMNLNQINQKNERVQSEIQEIFDERAKQDETLAEIEEEKKNTELEIRSSEQLENVLSSDLQRMQHELEERQKEEDRLMKVLGEVRVELASLSQDQNYLAENRQRLGEELAKSNEELDSLTGSRGENQNEIREKEEKIRDLENTISDSGELIEEIQEIIREKQAEKEESSKKHRSFLRKREDLASRIADLDKEIFRTGSRKDTLNENMESQINYMWEEYELTYGSAVSLRDESLVDLAMIRKSIQNLKGEIKNLGSVNVNAIEEFKELAERYEFLKTQHDDLIRAEESLRGIIEELDQAMRKQFSEQFGRIKEEFNTVFRELFGGGKGTLELVEDEDVLEAGVRVIAQPPGKKLQNMMQLSGGEKALTAISLLFAIQNLKPSPFCLLDEIEAALDDSNVTRYAQYLHKLTEHTQFIVITHRRGTMNASDRLYGITMQEKGISTLVSVDLLEDELNKEEKME